jgi:hypothetical protein
MSDVQWHPARLIPTSGIGGTEEQERRATSALLAVLTVVTPFGRSLLARCGAPAGNVEAFIEVPFDLAGRRVYPDGLIRVTRGKTVWTALVEVKTGVHDLEPKQLENYLDVAREEGFDAVITISNQLSSMPGTHPTPIDGRKLRRVALHHFSWIEILTQAVMEKVHRGVTDPEQSWILGELIRYLEHEKSGALEIPDMGASWVAVRDGAVAGTLRVSDKAIGDVAQRWDQLSRFTCLRLGRQLGVEVQMALTRKELTGDASRTSRLVARLVDDGLLDGGLRIPNLPHPLVIGVDLRAGRVFCSLEIAAPATGRAQTRVNWLIRQLEAAPDDLRVDAFSSHARGSASELLRDVRADPKRIIHDPQREIRSFRLTASAPMGTRRGAARGSFVRSLLDLLDDSYEHVVQNLKPWTAPPPPMKDRGDADAVGIAPAPDSADAPSRAPSADGSRTVAATTEASNEGDRNGGEVRALQGPS